MNFTQKILASFLLGTFSLSGLGVQAQTPPSAPAPAAPTPEAACFEILLGKTSFALPADFASIDFDNLKKKSGVVESGSFSVKGYNDFLTLSKLPVPKPSNLYLFPSEPAKINKLKKNQIEAGKNKVYKANRNNVGKVQITSNKITNIGNVDSDPAPEKFRGYYLDSRILTFGNQVDELDFPFQSSDANTYGTGDDYPNGEPYADMRDRLLYTHHLKTGEFLSCGLVKIVPETSNGFYLSNADITDPATQRVINRSLYGGDTLLNSKFLVSPKNHKGHKFQIGNINARIVAKEADTENPGNFNYKTPLLQYQALSVAYDNGSAYMNEYITLPLQAEVMTKARNADKGIMEATLEFLKRLKNETSLGIASGKMMASVEDSSIFSKSLKASLIENEVKLKNNSYSGLSVYEDVPFELLDEVKQIPDQGIQTMMHALLSPSFKSNVASTPEENQSELHQQIINSPISRDEVIENIAYVIERAGGGANVVAENLEYLDVNFGDLVFVPDRRLAELYKTNPLEKLVEELDREKSEKLEAIKSMKTESPSDEVAKQLKNQEVERDYDRQLQQLQELEPLYRDQQKSRLSLEIKKDNQRISEAEYKSAVNSLEAEFDSNLNNLDALNSVEFFDEVVVDSATESVNQALLESKSVTNEKTVTASVDPGSAPSVQLQKAQKNNIGLAAFGLFLLGLLILLVGIHFYARARKQ